ncbi:MAG: helix-turn-helix domain-containing protein [Bacilli bacterium]
MKEIGEKLKEARESMGVSLDEAAEDLKLRPSQIENIEEGNIEAFKDVFYLKYFIRDYSKYLGLKYEDMVDEFNEFLFDYTSKISLSDIKNAQKKCVKKEDVKKIASPYTMSKSRKPIMISTVIYIIIGILLIISGYFIITLIKKDDFVEEKPIEAAYIIGRNYEITK